MIKNVIGAWAGAKLAKSSPKVSTPGGATGGALAASVVPALLARMSIPAMLLIGAGAYVWKRKAAAKTPVDAEPSPAGKTASTPANSAPAPS